jgi:hypothetical protein
MNINYVTIPPCGGSFLLQKFKEVGRIKRIFSVAKGFSFNSLAFFQFSDKNTTAKLAIFFRGKKLFF